MSKRLFDVIISTILLVLFLPLLLVVSLLVFWQLGRPVLFVHVRPGVGGKGFNMYKFRTMLDTRDANGLLLPHEQRLSRFGTLLRSTSLDELPELWNVLKGDMSLVGPRPLLMDYLSLYTPEQFRRHDVRPGITGWAQVNGRNTLTWDEKFRLDVWYVDNATFCLDLKILLLTAKQVIMRTDIDPEGHAVTPLFTGARSTQGDGGNQSD
ncbi:sugar transferase [Halomonas sp. HK25]|uniref:sugar transferase n=1 Tax=Halomonas sp. HK25 TaxID=3394321 RepID=UPI0039FD83AF